MSARAERLAENEAFFRELNERLEESTPTSTPELIVVCECADEDCARHCGEGGCRAFSDDDVRKTERGDRKVQPIWNDAVAKIDQRDREIAETLGIKPGTVAATIHQAQEHLRDRLEVAVDD